MGAGRTGGAGGVASHLEEVDEGRDRPRAHHRLCRVRVAFGKGFEGGGAVAAGAVRGRAEERDEGCGEEGRGGEEGVRRGVRGEKGCGAAAIPGIASDDNIAPIASLSRRAIS